MAVLKCKMCGGDLEIVPESTVCECAYCGTKQTVPTADNEKKLNLFNRANRLRMASEFDKAASIYENIIAEFPEEAEAYWCLCLCNYGIEYVDDPATARKIPTCHRASFESLQKDENFALALEYADVIAQKVYRDEAREIDRIMGEILAVSKNEKPYDVFICYKETDENGERTVDSVLAQDIYDALTAKNYKVFFARVTLEDKLGMQYEPYIFAALNSAKVMLAVGTKYEYFHAVWVQNEWSRFLKLAAKDKSKVLIPCFKDLDAYDMPEEFKALQAQDLGKIGAMQDLVRGVEKLVGNNASAAISATTAKGVTGPNVEALVKRGFMALEDKQWANAGKFLNEVLNMDAECAEAYLGLAMAEARVSSKRDFVYRDKLDNANYKRAKQFASDSLLAELTALEKAAEEERIRFATIRKKLTGANGLVSAGSDYTVGLKSDGTVVAVGENKSDRCYVADWTDIVAISTGRYHTVGLRKDSTVVAGGYNACGVCEVADWTDIVAISAGENHTVGLKKDGTVVATKYTGELKYYRGQCDVAGWTDIVAISAGYMHTVGLKKDGTVVAVGENKYDQCAVAAWTDIVAISAGDNHTVGLKKDGTVVAVGANYCGQCEVAGWTDIVAISAGFKHTVGLKKDGTVVATKYLGELKYYRGQCDVSGWTDIVAISAGDYHTVGLKKDGTVVATKYIGELKNYCGQCDVFGWKLFDDFDSLEEERIKREKVDEERAKKSEADKIRLEPIRKKLTGANGLISAGSEYTVGLKSDGTVVATKYTGEYYTGQCDVADWTDIVAISAGSGYTVGLKKDGTVVATKYTGDLKYYRGECDVADWTDIVAISVGGFHTVGLKSDGTVVAVGENEYGECDVAAWTDIVAISAGWNHTVGLKKNGMVVATGRHWDRMRRVVFWRDVVAISVGHVHTVGLKKDGTVVAVGKNEYGGCDVAAWTDIVAISAGWNHTVGLKSDGTVVATKYTDDLKYYRGQCDVAAWTDIVAISAGNNHTVGLKKDGTVMVTEYIGEYYRGQCDVDGWKLFDDFDNLEEEQKQKMAEKRVAIEKQKAAAYRSKGLCQHCGGSFKGLFTKKCTNCGKEKDY